MKIVESNFGTTASNDNVIKYTLINDEGSSVSILNFGGIITDINVPDKSGTLKNVVLSYDNFESYKTNPPHLGSIIGRFAGRIANGHFTLNDMTYTLPQNARTNCLHGGVKGFDKVIWDAATNESDKEVSLSLDYLSIDGEEGFPGNLKVNVTYTWDNEQRLKILYSATTDKQTPIALTNHSYFNLSNDLATDILDHELMIAANEYVEIDDLSLPKKISNVENSPFDFRSPKNIEQDISEDHEQIKLGNGYDHPFIADDSVDVNASVYCPRTGRYMEVFTDADAVVFYSANHLDASVKVAGTNGSVKNGALCLETQPIPNNMNFDAVETHTIKPGDEYRSETVFRFSVK